MEKQKTIGREFFLEGKGLQTGRPVRVFFYPEGENRGITLMRRDLEGRPSVRLGWSVDFDADRRSKINLGKGECIETTEHFLAALWGLEIDNIRIELDSSEPPALDGSAKLFLEALEKAGVKEEGAERQFIEIKEPLWVEDKGAFLGVFPSAGFKISYIFEYPDYSIERQFFSEAVTPEVFREKLAPARTLWFVPPGPGSIRQKASLARALGYGRGADENNALIITKDGIANKARFPDEPVRHKVLDLIGDLYLLGKPIKGRIIALRSGHKLNLELVKKIKECI